MPVKVVTITNIQGLSTRELPALQKQYGRNILQAAAQHRLLHILWDIMREPMFILLAIACSLYFVLGNTEEGIMMAVAIGIVGAISVYQEVKSSRAIAALKQLTEPKVTVIRDGAETVIDIEALVPGDIAVLEEGMKIPADAIILQSNDLEVNESLVTGESFPVDKNEMEGSNLLYQGTAIERGKCVARVTATGNHTLLGKIGKSIEDYAAEKTLLQLQLNKFVRKLALFGLSGFVIIFLVNYLHYGAFATSLLFALTLAMAAVPEEIPVAFSSFMALGAYKMSRLGIISRQPQVIENLGSVNVICLDKTGTITENKMQLKVIYDYKKDQLTDCSMAGNLQDNSTFLYGVLASERHPYDAMEKAIQEAYLLHTDGSAYETAGMIYEYPLDGRPPMMTHVYQTPTRTIAAGKGAAERIIAVCRLQSPQRDKLLKKVQELAANGYRVLGVASAVVTNTAFPASQNEFDWQLEGLLALYDPPKKNIASVISHIYEAKATVKLITGDYPETAINIARQCGIANALQYHTGEEVIKMDLATLQTAVKTTTVFARMFPDAKLKVINAIKANGDIVAMTGDGVNDAPALKAADIGIAMGRDGSQTARQAADLVLTDDNLEKIVLGVREGRKIYSNLVKAIRYIITIHIPVILTASLPVVLGWRYPNLFTPIHIIFLELVMGPTCSIFFEREPVEENTIMAGPHSRKSGLFTTDELLIAVVQGLVVTAGCLALYYIFMRNGHSIKETRTIVFTSLIFSNLFLTFSSRSFTQTINHTIRYKNNLAPVLLIVTAVFLFFLHFVPAVRDLFQLAPITASQFWLCSGVAFVSVMWFEVYKMDLRKAGS